jgi:excisionase family DNA binding protein
VTDNLETTIKIDNVTINTQIAGKSLFLTVAEAAVESRFSESFLRKLMRDGQLPHFKGEGNNGRILIRTDELLAFMELRRVVAPASLAI